MAAHKGAGQVPEGGGQAGPGVIRYDGQAGPGVSPVLAYAAALIPLSRHALCATITMRFLIKDYWFLEVHRTATELSTFPE